MVIEEENVLIKYAYGLYIDEMLWKKKKFICVNHLRLKKKNIDALFIENKEKLRSHTSQP